LISSGPAGRIYKAVETAVQATGGEVGDVAPLLTRPNLGEVSEDPQVFQNNLENRVSAVKAAAFLAFGNIKVAWSRAPLEFWDRYVEVEQLRQHEKWKTMAATVQGDEFLPRVEYMAEELERGMWAKYVNADPKNWVGNEVYQRFIDLGITQEAGAPGMPYGRGGIKDWPRWMRQEKLAAWASGYQVENFRLKPNK
jgi:hypothetical protein